MWSNYFGETKYKFQVRDPITNGSNKFIFCPSQVNKTWNTNKNMHSNVGFCEHYCGQMITLTSDTIGKWPLKREHLFLMEFVLLLTVVPSSTMHRFKYMSMECNRKTQFAGSEWYSVSFRLTSSSLRYKLFWQRYTTIFNLSVSVMKYTHTFLLP